MSARRIRFCLSIDHGEWSRGDARSAVSRTIEYARLADASGFDSLWLNEDPDGWDASAVLGALSRETTSIRLGTGVTNVFHRNPNLIAGSVATLDRLSDGRAFLGVGRGQPEVYDRTFGIDVSRPLEQLESAIVLLRQWWGEDRVACGPPLRARWPRTLGPQTMPPVYIAAVGPKALQLAGRVSDGVLFNELATPEYIHWAVSRVVDEARRRGRDAESLRFFVNPATVVTDDPEPVIERKKSLVAMVHALPGMDRLLMTDEWDVPAIMEDVRAAMRTSEVLGRGGLFVDIRKVGDLDRARKVIPGGLIDAASAIGPVDKVRAKLSDFASAGATDLFIDRRGLPSDVRSVTALINSLSPG
ncbi:MAG: LLM class flavin-dependent oxidoreductase [Thermomicrobiales bacterium]